MTPSEYDKTAVLLEYLLNAEDAAWLASAITDSAKDVTDIMDIVTKITDDNE